VHIDPDACYRALAARDRRFDGLFFAAVRTTGIYCRPICPARTPARQRCTFYSTAAEAEKRGYRACFRCRPELAPRDAAASSHSSLVEAALTRIHAGALNQGSIEDLAAELGVSDRHLRRSLRDELGVSAVELAQSRRMAMAKQLLQETSLAMTEIAFASGFSSVRRFNALFRARFGRSPSALVREERPATNTLLLRLDYRPPLDWKAMLEFLAARAIPGVESVDLSAGVYRRTAAIGALRGWLAVRADPEQPALRAEISMGLAGALMAVVARLRRFFDLDARPDAVASFLGKDARLRPLLARRPGLRVPGAFEPFEMAVRALLGQQVSVRAATTLAGRFAAALGEPAATPHPELTRFSPDPASVRAAGAELSARIGVPAARGRALVALAAAVERGLALACSPDLSDTLDALRALPGVGDWTAEYVAMRALAWPDAFPAGDLGLRRALGDVTAAQARRIAETWRPWRSYAAIHLWTNLADHSAPGARHA
jgi:AraC family transcriptional regulator of adaptative response / DNA-3-methyladenine glycosylase II